MSSFIYILKILAGGWLELGGGSGKLLYSTGVGWHLLHIRHLHGATQVGRKPTTTKLC